MPSPPAIIALIGLRGVGKTTVGRLLAQRCGRPFVDLDEVTPRILNAPSVAAAWNRHGEAAFRRAELRALIETLANDGSVLALGGGTPTAPGAADLLIAERDAGRVRIVYLAAPARSLRRRLRAGGTADRPSLTGADPVAEVEAVLAARDPLYRTLATEVIETAGRSAEDVLEEIVRLITPPG